MRPLVGGRSQHWRRLAAHRRGILFSAGQTKKKRDRIFTTFLSRSFYFFLAVRRYIPLPLCCGREPNRDRSKRSACLFFLWHFSSSFRGPRQATNDVAGGLAIRKKKRGTTTESPMAGQRPPARAKNPHSLAQGRQHDPADRHEDPCIIHLKNMYTSRHDFFKWETI